ncbi:hypothetical protein O6H91_02G110600 [Diphasiastrum complanatum]|nr:hypothetical protein O6H91_02G110600 [Diphasiastrum complanatum]KAJ7566597.1 hypothetical protein O6H91_02G110600 [Diphasiastrum complanatum]KAJ7566598.1 hypothetical protein O6H91_02G110600 [Diphasiastrum complanatum]KAJ7566600.1 hypothetical protein O6H91_02G110600 [Diphasiastrum complanatum]KAJ7566601.1 hypothetical protein O6H91_02G110600 [Diphasiastrum complanatum]
MGSGWRTAKALLGISTWSLSCTRPDETFRREFNDSGSGKDRCHIEKQIGSDSDLGGGNLLSPSRLNLIQKSIRFTRSSCAICLESIKQGQGHALFTAECTHTFHFSCIAANVRHGNFFCPVCRAKWKEVPWQAPLIKGVHEERAAVRRLDREAQRLSQQRDAENDPTRSESSFQILPHANANRQRYQLTTPSEPNVFDDDEPLNEGTASEELLERLDNGQTILCEERNSQESESMDIMAISRSNQAGHTVEADGERHGLDAQENIEAIEKPALCAREEGKEYKIEMTAYVEMESVLYSQARDNFTVLVHLKSPAAKRGTSSILANQLDEEHESTLQPSPRSQNCVDGLLESSPCTDSRTPIDLVTVLDVSGSMSGGKLRLLKRAMAFLISNLRSEDRLSVIAFSSSAKRVLPLRRMVEPGRQSALRAVDSLISAGGTNIAEGLAKGAKVLEDRRVRNPVASIILLSDGQDMHGFNMHRELSSPHLRGRSNHQKLLLPIRQCTRQGHPRIPVHTFGLGTDHDATVMHSIAQISGGTYSFIQTEAAVQDAFAQCIGGLLSVVVQDIEVKISSGMDKIQLKKLHAGSYDNSINDSCDTGLVKLGDLYADEERDILVDLRLPAVDKAPMEKQSKMVILKVQCTYKNPVSRRSFFISMPEISVSRPIYVFKEQLTASVEVDSQRNRLLTAQSIADAGEMADRGDIAGAQRALQLAKTALRESVAWQAGDQLSKALDTELFEIQTRMSNRQLYERTGRAYALSAHNSHFGQRAATRGDSVSNHSSDYQTPSMVDMICHSQTFGSSTQSASAHSSTPGASQKQSIPRRSNRRVNAIA